MLGRDDNKVIKMKKILLTLSLLFIVSLLNACAKNVSPNTYDSSEVGVASKVVPGTIVAIRQVSIDANSGAGGLAGVAAGGTAGSLVGGSTAGTVLGVIGGAVVGGVVGNAADKAINHHNGYEYIIKLNNKSVISITQVEDLKLSVNQRVLIIYGAMTRIVPDTTTQNLKG